jgi:7,8-didemethyl-8-hydroxy-5-deazariboflavin synthase CofH subunit
MTFEEALAAAAQGDHLSLDASASLLAARGVNLRAMMKVADQKRAEQVGDTVTYVINRNVNFTNVCIKRCHFCAFSDDLRTGSGYFLPLEEVVRRAKEARSMGATEVCIQAGLAPELNASKYLKMTETVKNAVPDLHLHAWSPEEIKHGAKQSRVSIRSFLAELKAAGLDSLPGTSAEILDDRLRRRLAVGRISTAQWIDVIQTAHELDLPTTATMMFGHLETALDQAGHLLTLRRIQQQTGGFTEFVPLAFVHHQAPLFASHSDVRAGPSSEERLAIYSASRLILGDVIPNLQVSWVKEGLSLAANILEAGANDLGGTLINESISTAAGSSHGQRQTPEDLERVAQGIGRPVQQRSTLYQPIADSVKSGWGTDYGSFFELRKDHRFAYRSTGRPSKSARVSMSQASPRR